MTIRDIAIALGFDVDDASFKKAEKGVADFKNKATKVLGAIGVGLSITGIAKGIKDCVALSSEVEEMQNKFDVVFQGMTDDVEDWAQSYADAIGRNKNDINSYLADQQNLLVGFGMTREDGADLSKQMTTLALDLASFANIDETSAVEAMTKAVMGESESAKRLGAVLNDSTREQAMLSMGLKGTYNSLDQLTKMQVNYQAILSQSPDAIGDCERSLGSYASTDKSFQAKLKELKTIIGQFFMPTFQKVLSFGGRLVTMLRDATQKVSDFAKRVGGSERLLAVLAGTLGTLFLILNFKKLTDGLKTVGKLLGGISAKTFAIIAVVAVLALLIEDFLAFMRGDDSIIGTLFDKAGIGADNARKAIMDAFNKVKNFLVTTWNVIKNVLSAAWNGIKAVATTVFEGLKRFWDKHGEQIKTAFSNIWTGIKNVLSTVWGIIKSVAETVFNALKAFWDTWGSTIMTAFQGVWNNIKAIFSTVFDVLADLFAVFSALFAGDWGAFWENIKALFSDLWNGLVNIVSTVLESIWNVISSVFNVIWGFISGIVQKIWDTIVGAFTSVRDTVAGIFESIKETVSNVFNALVNIVKAPINGIIGFLNQLIDAMNSLSFDIPDWVPFVGGKKFGFDIPHIPLLAQGGYLKANSPRLAVVGDNPREGEIVAPESKLFSIFTSALNAFVAKLMPNGSTGSLAMAASNRSVVQNVYIQNSFSGSSPQAQKKGAETMQKSAEDATGYMARALQMAR